MLSCSQSILPLVRTQVESQIKGEQRFLAPLYPWQRARKYHPTHVSHVLRVLFLACAVRDFSKASVTLQPAEYASWGDARSEMMVEMKRPLKAQLAAELSAAPNDDARDEITQAFAAREKALEHDLDHKPMVRASLRIQPLPALRPHALLLYLTLLSALVFTGHAHGDLDRLQRTQLSFARPCPSHSPAHVHYSHTLLQCFCLQFLSK